MSNLETYRDKTLKCVDAYVNSLDEAAAAMLAQIVERRGIAAIVQPIETS